MAQFVARRLAVRQARVRFSARHHREVFPTERTSDVEMERGLSKWRWINVLHECDSMNVCILTLFYSRGLGIVVLHVMVPQPYRFSLGFFT